MTLLPIYPSRLFLTFSIVGNTCIWYIHTQPVNPDGRVGQLSNLTSCKFGYLCMDVSPVFLTEERLSSHSEQSQLWLAGPSEPMLENWPTTGHDSSREVSGDRCSDNTYSMGSTIQVLQNGWQLLIDYVLPFSVSYVPTCACSFQCVPQAQMQLYEPYI